jgi:hypothetical protein
VTRRVPLLVAGLCAAAVLSSCSTFDTSAAARVNGTKIDDAVVETLLAGGDATADTVARTALDGTQARVALAELIQSVVAEQVADRYDIDLSAARAADQAQTKKNLTGERLTKWSALTPDQRNLISDFGVGVDALKAARGPVPADLEQRYQNPASTGYFCIRYIAFPTEAAAAEAASKLRSGADFAQLADAVSGQKTGGVASGPDGSPCVGLDQFRPPNIPEPITSALFAAVPGQVTDPVHQSGANGEAWFVLVHRPWSEIGDELTKTVSAAPVYAEYLAEVARTRAEVASRYGVWDAVSASIVQHS